MKIQGVFGTFDFENTWFIDRNLEYQYPQLIHNRQIPKTKIPAAIEIISKPDKLAYFVGEEFDSTGLKVNIVYENGEKEETARYTLSGFESTVGTKTITVEYQGLTATFDVEVKEKPVSLVSIAIVKKPDKVSYFVGEEFDSTGLTVNAIYDNGTEKEITDYTLSGYESTVGVKTIMVNYNDFTATFDVEVKEKPVQLLSINVIKQPDKTVYVLGENLNTEGMILLGRYSNGTVKTIEDYSVSELTNDVGEQTVTVSFAGLTAEFKVTVENKQLLIGDANLDGSITISDVTAIQYYLAELTEFTDEQLALADTNGDGEVNISDATHLQMFLADFEGFVLGKS